MASEKTYISDVPHLMKEWNWEKNTDYDPNKLTVGSEKKPWWKCEKGHEWQAMIGSRSNGCGCPYCSGRYAIKGENDLQTANPILAKEWNYEKNNGLTPIVVAPNSHKKVWWKCNKGHEWQATIASRTGGSGCPYCIGQKVLKGYNDLQTVNPILAEEWNYEKNGVLSPECFTANSGKKVWWKCKKGHVWQAVIGSRNQGCDCPICHSEQHTSFPEYAIIFYLKKYGLDVLHSYKEKGYELDIFVPSKKVAIEYDGYHWHKNKNKQDLDKNSKCKKDGIKLYRIREGLPPLKDSSLDYVVQNDFPIVLEKVLCEIVGTSIDVNLEIDSVAIENLREFTEKNNSLLFSKPEIAKEWNNEKNGSLKPEYFRANSNKKVWWKCRMGHEWQTAISHRNNGSGCPYCSGLYTLTGVNDLQSVTPNLAEEWNYEKNDNLKPGQFMANSNKKVWWKCSKGHEWQTSIINRNNGNGCPYCSGRFVIKGENDLQTVDPELTSEWNYVKNGELTPMDVFPNSNQKVWWKCAKGHEWQAVIANRNKGSGCPFCSGRYPIKGKNDLQTANSALSKEWNYERNNVLKPDDVLPNSNKKVWWKCEKGHEWQAVIGSRNQGKKCPYCTGKKVLAGFNDLQTVNLILANEWHCEKNGDLKPEFFSANSGKKVWWKCGEGHEWQATIDRRSRGSGCPQCAAIARKSKSNK